MIDDHSGAKEKILDAARRHFAQYGYRGTTLRSVAADAGYDVALIAHYFGNKDGLFKDAISFPNDPQPIVEAVRDVPFDKLGVSFFDYIIKLWDSEMGARLLAAARVHVDDPGLFGEYIDKVVWEPIRSRLKNEGITAREVEKRIAFAQTQTTGVLVVRNLMKFPELVEFDRDQLIETYGRIIQSCLDGSVFSTTN